MSRFGGILPREFRWIFHGKSRLFPEFDFNCRNGEFGIIKAKLL